jgi:hypothetical protein
MIPERDIEPPDARKDREADNYNEDNEDEGDE